MNKQLTSSATKSSADNPQKAGSAVNHIHPDLSAKLPRNTTELKPPRDISMDRPADLFPGLVRDLLPVLQITNRRASSRHEPSNEGPCAPLPAAELVGLRSHYRKANRDPRNNWPPLIELSKGSSPFNAPELGHKDVGFLTDRAAITKERLQVPMASPPDIQASNTMVNGHDPSSSFCNIRNGDSVEAIATIEGPGSMDHDQADHESIPLVLDLNSSCSKYQTKILDNKQIDGDQTRQNSPCSEPDQVEVQGATTAFPVVTSVKLVSIDRPGGSAAKSIESDQQLQDNFQQWTGLQVHQPQAKKLSRHESPSANIREPTDTTRNNPGVKSSQHFPRKVSAVRGNLTRVDKLRKKQRDIAASRQAPLKISTKLNLPNPGTVADALQAFNLAYTKENLETEYQIRSEAEAKLELQRQITTQNEAIQDLTHKHDQWQAKFGKLEKLQKSTAVSQKYVAGLQMDHEKLQKMVASYQDECKTRLAEKIEELENEKQVVRQELDTTLQQLSKSHKNMRATLHEFYVRLRLSELERKSLKDNLSRESALLEQEKDKNAELKKSIIPGVRELNFQISKTSTAMCNKVEALQCSFDTQDRSGVKEKIDACLDTLRQIQNLPHLTLENVQKAEGMLRFIHER